MTDLSSAAQAVLNAYETSYTESGLVAALKAAAAESPPEINIPFAMVEEWERIEGVCSSFYAAAEWGYKQGLTHFLAIAAELEAQP